ncbi:(2S)-3-sulfopropanediol dehydratase [Desulfofundulus salinus]|uniref:Formate C-acetyltransferase/glycerol dehydratase family glycyl radical enzyme n=1 Tax=Desulfofundulus salinus TaxID=2419843 RepID=A0A494X2X8_9FIRM|nr:formate C-acetyltransferase/glycerol dehydratase family glycyl radical enzyme [Desulfofundulus salinum]RKO67535.1 formate C-acetyltransferase/glycerol dehydratase family glycyl radical enzyme [Desulfofundulus salinum]
MEFAEKVLTPQEQRILRGREIVELTTEEGRNKRKRVNKLLAKFASWRPRVSIERALLFTESFKETESLPMVLRWAKAMEHILNNIEVVIGEDELIVGTCGGLGRHSILYPELRGCWLEEGLQRLKEQGSYIISDEDIKIVKEKIVPYWKGKTAHETYINLLPEETRYLIYGDDIYSASGLMQDNANINATLNWAPDYKKVLEKGFLGIKQEAEEKLRSLDVVDLDNHISKAPFLKAVIIVCDAMIAFAKRYAKLAREMALKEKDEKRKKELETIAEVCEWVPAHPARTFHEAIQSQWFTQVGFRLEQPTTGVISNGRIDQYLYPYYKKDLEEGRIDEDSALELLECLWLKIAEFVPLNATNAKSFWEGYAHFEQTVIGGQTRDGSDATNELSYLILKSKKEFPLHYPDLSVRIHSRTPEPFLREVCELIREGTGFPKLLNDEEIIPHLLAQGASLEDARDYTGCACTEIRMVNTSTYMVVGGNINLPAALEMALNDGVLKLRGKKQKLGVSTGDSRNFATFDEVMNAFRLQVEYLVKHFYIRQTALEITNSMKLAAPLMSSLHDVCMNELTDIHQPLKGGVSADTGNINFNGFGTVVESLAAIKKLVYDDRKITMNELLEALESNFEGKEALRQMLLNAPKYGNNDPYADNIAREVDAILLTAARKFKTPNGHQYIKFVPVTSHVGLGAVLGATPNGRKAGEPLSEGISPTQGVDTKGPIATLLSIDKAKSRKYSNSLSRLLNIKLSPQVVAGEKGLRDLMTLVRTFCDLKLWHIQFNILNSDILRDAQKHPEKYRNLIVRVAGYSAYFVDLSPELQNEIINRTEHQFM